MTDNFENDTRSAADVCSTAIHRDYYSADEHHEAVTDAIHALLACFDDDGLGYNDGRANVLHQKLLDTLCFMSDNEPEFFQKMVRQDAVSYKRALRMGPGEIRDQRMEQLEARLDKNLKAVTCFQSIAKVCRPLYRDITGTEWRNRKNAKFEQSASEVRFIDAHETAMTEKLKAFGIELPDENTEQAEPTKKAS